jgi:hypothetical protein
MPAVKHGPNGCRFTQVSLFQVQQLPVQVCPLQLFKQAQLAKPSTTLHVPPFSQVKTEMLVHTQTSNVFKCATAKINWFSNTDYYLYALIMSL